MEPRSYQCEKCGAPMIEESRHLVGLVERDHDPFKGYALRYARTFICPARRGFLGAFRNGHDRKETTDYD